MSKPEGTFWSLLGDVERSALRSAGTEREFAAGSVICQQGEPSQHVVVVRRGRVRVTSTSADGKEVVMAVRGEGEILGELAAVDGNPRSATLQAEDDVRALVIPPSRVSALCRAHPVVAWAMLHVVVSRQRATGLRHVGGTTIRRVATVLVDVACRRGMGSSGDLIGTVPLSQQELAGIAGVSRESLVRALKVMRDRGIIRTRRKHITILREDELRELCVS